MFSETRSRSVVGAAVLSSCFTIARKSLSAGGHKGSLKTSVLLFNKKLPLLSSSFIVILILVNYDRESFLNFREHVLCSVVRHVDAAV